METEAMTPAYVNPMQWNQSVGYARQVCARVFRDGGRPQDALVAFGLEAGRAGDKDLRDWSRTVEMIAEAMCAQPERCAA